MKTIEVKWIIDDDDEKGFMERLGTVFEQEFGSAPLYHWNARKSNKKEKAWRKLYDKHE